MDKDSRAFCQIYGRVRPEVRRIRIGSTELTPAESRQRFFRRRRIVRTIINLSLVSLVLCLTFRHAISSRWYVSIPIHILAAVVPLFFICIFTFPCIMTVYYLIKLLPCSERWHVHPQKSSESLETKSACSPGLLLE